MKWVAISFEAGSPKKAHGIPKTNPPQAVLRVFRVSVVKGCYSVAGRSDMRNCVRKCSESKPTASRLASASLWTRYFIASTSTF